MPSLSSLLALSLLPALALSAPASLQERAVKQTFVPPSNSPLEQSSSYPGRNNGTLVNPPYVKGAAFDRIIQIWMENTNFASAAGLQTFKNFAAKGQLLTSFYGLTHPSEPNYIAAAFGDFFGLNDDSFSFIPPNITSVFDLLDEKSISYACYQENMPTDGFQANSATQASYSTAGTSYTYYARKHNPCAFSETFATNQTRAHRNRNMNDFAVDASADALPQWTFITPNLVNDAHDSGITEGAKYLDWFLGPLMNTTKFNSDRTLVVVTFDESESYNTENRIYTVLLGGALPSNVIGTQDDTYMTHYSMLSTVEANWGLKNLGRGDVNATLSNVLPWVASASGYTGNKQVAQASRPQLNLTGIYNGPLNSKRYTLFPAPQSQSAPGAGKGGVLFLPGLNKAQTADKLKPVDLTTSGQTNYWHQSSNVGKSQQSSSARFAVVQPQQQQLSTWRDSALSMPSALYAKLTSLL